ncbi:Unknown protein [Striga hermonthica]|uniref:EGF-like domain-containing protein n=1 Tax=Striga hermonthica TaxID=68872 RepID=A0A9N7RIY5_STRHE|nr:Unknown protein [Striga hermonthica]
MALTNCQSLVILVLLLPIATKGDDHIPPSLSPFFENLCNEVECGRGSCEAAPGYPFNFRCDCDDGWRRTRLEDDDERDLEFLPCIIPNCSLNYSCMPAPPPVPPNPHNLSYFDPCYWVYCGAGSCTRNATHTHTCQCNPGYSNLLNISAFPCYNDCAVNSNSCGRLGIVQGRSTSNTNPASENNQGGGL